MAVSKMLGHASFVTTITVYATTSPKATEARPRRCDARSLAGWEPTSFRCADRVSSQFVHAA